MALPNEIHPFAIAGGGNQYQVANSLRFRNSATAYLTRTAGSAGNTQKWTWSAWIKRGLIGVNCGLFNGRVDGNNVTELYIKSDDTIHIVSYISNVNKGEAYTPAVLRDPSAWYHIVCAMDTTQSSFANGWTKIWINGVLQTLTVSTSAVQNINTQVNGANSHQIGSDGFGLAGSPYFDGYMAEINHIDGQQLDPTYFGQTDSITNQWVPKKYTGTYGTNGFYLPFNTSTAASYAGSFNGSSKSLTISGLTPNLSTYGNFTIEAWINISSFSPDPQFIWGSGNSTSCGYVYSTGAIGMGISGTSEFKSSTGVISTGTWYHVAWVVSGSNINIYVNGTSVASTSSASTYLSNTTNAFVIGFRGDVTYYFNGSISNFRFNNTALYTAAFTPKGAPLTAVSGTQLLTLQSSTIIDNSTNAYTITNNGTVATSAATPWTNYIAGMDYSGNNNGWTSSGISITSGTTYDFMIDSPTDYNDGGNNRGNYCTFNPAATSSRVTLSNGSLTATKDSFADWNSTLSTYMVSSGKWYYEFLLGTTTNKYFIIGYVKPDFGWWNLSQYPGNASGSYGLDCPTGNKRTGDVSTSYGSGFVSADIAQVALDLDNGKIWWGKNGTWFASGDPAAGTNAAYTSVTGPLIPALGMYTSETGSINFGQRPFSYTPPSGFKALNSYNLANPSLPLV